MNLSTSTDSSQNNQTMTTPSANGNQEGYFQAQALHKLRKILEWKQENTDLKKWTENILSELVPFLGGLQGTFFAYQDVNHLLVFKGGFALDFTEDVKKEYRIGEGFIGQVAKNREILLLDNNEAFTALTSSKKIRLKTIIIAPLIYKDSLLGIIEINFPQNPPKYVCDFLKIAIEGLSANLYASPPQQYTAQNQHTEAQIHQENIEILHTEIPQEDSPEKPNEWRSLAMMVSESIVFVNPQWDILDHNPAFEALFGDSNHKGNNLKAYLNIMSYDVSSIKEKLQNGAACESIGIHKTGETFRISLQSYQSKGDERGIILKPLESQTELLNNPSANESSQQAQALEEVNSALHKIKKELQKKDKQLKIQAETAQTIQDLLLVPIQSLQEVYQNLFVFYKSVEQTGGDLYWIRKENQKTIMASIDCTGKGTAGAMMCMMVNNLMTQIVSVQQMTSPEKILSQLHQYILYASKTNSALSYKGIKASIVVLDEQKHTMEFAGAKQSLIYFQNKELHEIPGDTMSVGGFSSNYEGKRTFQKHSIQLNSGLKTTAYLPTDGYESQFGGDRGRKFLKNNLRKVLQEIHTQPIDKQAGILDEIIQEWKKDENQTDDMLIIGLQV